MTYISSRLGVNEIDFPFFIREFTEFLKNTVFDSRLDIIDLCRSPSQWCGGSRNWKTFALKFNSIWCSTDLLLNRYRRRLETCPKANLAESGREFFLLFFRRARATSMTKRRVENTRVHFWTISPVSKKIVPYIFKIFFELSK